MANSSNFSRPFKKGSHYYYRGNEELPAPLNVEDERRLLAMLGGAEDSAARNELIERNLRLVLYIARRFGNTGVNAEDLFAIGSIGLIKAVHTFKPEKNIKLATYATRCIENEILMELRRHKRTKDEISLDEPLSVDREGNTLRVADTLQTDEDVTYRDMENEVEHDLLMKAVEKLKQRDQQIIELRYVLKSGDKEKQQKESAFLMGVTQSYISKLEKKICERLRIEIEKMS